MNILLTGLFMYYSRVYAAKQTRFTDYHSDTTRTERPTATKISVKEVTADPPSFSSIKRIEKISNETSSMVEPSVCDIEEVNEDLKSSLVLDGKPTVPVIPPSMMPPKSSAPLYASKHPDVNVALQELFAQNKKKKNFK